MADHKPRRGADGERETLMGLLQFQRDSVVRKVEGVSDADARRAFVGSGTSLLWLVKHLTRAEWVWFVARFAGDVAAAEAMADDAVGPDDDLAGAVARYRSMWATVDGIVSSAGLDDVARAAGKGPAVNLRWIVAHLLEETARHAGHADIIREMLDGTTGR